MMYCEILFKLTSSLPPKKQKYFLFNFQFRDVSSVELVNNFRVAMLINLVGGIS